MVPYLCHDLLECRQQNLISYFGYGSPVLLRAVLQLVALGRVRDNSVQYRIVAVVHWNLRRHVVLPLSRTVVDALENVDSEYPITISTASNTLENVDSQHPKNFDS